MNENDPRVGDVKIFGISFRRLTLTRIAGCALVFFGFMRLVDAFFWNESVVWWKLLLGIAMLAPGILSLFARAADSKDT